ncbi:MAG: hypothetical protein QME64_06375 [bacterium]|nr:hypothetical protein [bacterium]
MQKMYRCFIVLIILFSFSSVYGALLQPGPENQGLRLRLTITSLWQEKEDTHTVRLDLLNVGKDTVTLVAHWPYEQDTGNYAEFLKSEVMLITHPEVHPDSAQTGGAMRTSPQPKQILKPGETLTIKWQVKGPRLKPKGYYNTSPIFPSDGLYSVRAEMTFVLENKQEVLLISNPQQISIGRSIKMPKYATAHIILSNPTIKTVRIDLGSIQKIETGDTFLTDYFPYAAWRLRITEVYPSFSEGSVETIAHTGESRVPLFPELHWVATLRPKEELKRSE